MLFSYFVYIAHFTEFARESFLFQENLCSWKNPKAKKVVGEKKKGEKKRKGTNLSRKEKNFLCESDWYWQSSKLASRFQTKKWLSNQNLPYIM